MTCCRSKPRELVGNYNLNYIIKKNSPLHRITDGKRIHFLILANRILSLNGI